jgi:hypothetical protein
MGLTHLKPRIFPPVLDRFYAYLPSTAAATVPRATRHVFFRSAHDPKCDLACEKPHRRAYRIDAAVLFRSAELAGLPHTQQDCVAVGLLAAKGHLALDLELAASA